MPPMGRSGRLEVNHKQIQVEWKIDDFFSLSEDTGCYYDSPVFRFMNASWYLRIYPAGEVKDEDGSVFISVYVLKESGPGPAETLIYKLGIKRNCRVKELANCCTSFSSLHDPNGSEKFFLRSELLQRKSQLAPSDVLTITCSLTTHNDPYTVEKDDPMKLIELETLSTNFKDLLVNEKNCDLTLKVKDKEFRVHKSVLAARSTVFAAMLEHDMSEKESGVVSIADCDPNSFGDFLQYLYTGKAEDISSRNAVHLYITADKYDVGRLKSFCLEYMMQNLTVDTLCDIIKLADQYDETSLLSAAQEFFNKNARQVVLTSEWETLLKENYRLANKLIIEMTSKMKIED